MGLMAKDDEADDLNLGSIIDAARQRSSGQRGRRSPVYHFMWDNHAQLAPELNHPRRPSWAAMAQALGNQGVLDGAGQVLAATSAETVCKTWWKVNRDKEAIAAGSTRRRRAKQVQTTPSPPADAGSADGHGLLPPGVEPAEAEAPRFTFEFFKAKDWTKETDTQGG